MAPLLLPLLLAAAPPLHAQSFRLEREAEAVAVIRASCERCAWGEKGREAAVLELTIDGRLSQHLVLTRGARGEYRLLLGALRGEAKEKLLGELYCPIPGHWTQNPLDPAVGAVRDPTSVAGQTCANAHHSEGIPT